VIGKLPGDAIILPTNDVRSAPDGRGGPYPDASGQSPPGVRPKPSTKQSASIQKRPCATTNRRKSCIASNKQGLADEQTLRRSRNRQGRGGDSRGGGERASQPNRADTWACRRY